MKLLVAPQLLFTPLANRQDAGHCISVVLPFALMLIQSIALFAISFDLKPGTSFSSGHGQRLQHSPGWWSLSRLWSDMLRDPQSRGMKQDEVQLSHPQLS